jgi:hypothetical protein
MGELLTRVSRIIESINASLEITRSDYLEVKKSQKETVKKIFGGKHTGENWDVRECMNEIFGRTLTEEEFNWFYPLYALGFQTGRGVGLASKKQALESMKSQFTQKESKNTTG